MDKELLDIVADRTYSNWKSLANELGLEGETIEELDKSNSLYKEKARRMLDVWDQEISIGCEKLSLLVRACRHSGNAELANELEQGRKDEFLVTHSILCFKLLQTSMLINFEKIKKSQIKARLMYENLFYTRYKIISAPKIERERERKKKKRR